MASWLSRRKYFKERNKQRAKVKFVKPQPKTYDEGTITVSTDAGFLPYNGMAAWAYWITISSAVRIKNSGLFKTKLESAVEAETKAICNALHALGKTTFEFKKMIINRDCRNARPDKNGNKLEKLFHDAINSLVKEKPFEFRYEVRHVPAHRANYNSRNYVNNWCDAQCTKHLTPYKQSKNNTVKNG
jgi:ribonuclease HI